MKVVKTKKETGGVVEKMGKKEEEKEKKKKTHNICAWGPVSAAHTYTLRCFIKKRRRKNPPLLEHLHHQTGIVNDTNIRKKLSSSLSAACE